MKRTWDFNTAIPIRLSQRADLHLARKAWHLFMGLVIATIYMAGMERSTAVVILGSVLGWDLVMETLRLRSPTLNQKIVRLWGPLMRSSEVDRLSGVPYYLSAAILAIGIFPKPIAVLSIVFLAVGDPLASLSGILFGDLGPRFKNGKSLIGTAVAVLSCVIAAIVFLPAYGVGSWDLAIIALLGGLAGGTAEILPLDVDDNFSIPVVSGFALWLLFILTGASA